ncbi:galactose mutarotase [Pelomonas sp. V22]|uniref:aldose epimerase family protein n=1 Tax=Pelomonas sp. V22 TaxID=2822139 RepID=UPI0024A8C29F|nr:aldose epimerase family protein [Pelomonas sp. V22]MDI4635652.1 galactose mutarotase [Pelomonas sp. V22]
MAITEREYGRLADGRIVHEYRLDNGQGLTLTAINLGGIVTGLWVPDAQGASANVVLGFDNLDDYVQRNPHFGVIVGRYGNRIARGRFELEGKPYQLDLNDGPNTLHGGSRGFGTRCWEAQIEGDSLLFTLDSADGDQGFPGRLQARVRYSLAANERSWRIDYEATCDAATVVNLTHHDYFNLTGQGSVLRHRLTIPASRYTEVDAVRIPTDHASVAGTPFDFRAPKAIVTHIREAHPQIVMAKGYDHNWVLDAPVDGGLRLAACLEDPASGRRMEVHTTEPAIQFYSGNFLDGSLVGPSGQAYRQGDGLCLETQHSPDSPNHAVDDDWPSTVLRPGEVYRSTTVHRFY